MVHLRNSVRTRAVTALFATSAAFYWPELTAEPDARLDCEYALVYPHMALISPFIHEIPAIKPQLDETGSKERGWIEKKKISRYPVVRRRRSMPKPDPETPRPDSL